MWLLSTEGQQWLDGLKTAKIDMSSVDVGAVKASAKSSSKSVRKGVQAIIPIRGVLSERFDVMAEYFGSGSTPYSWIVRAAQEADSDSEIDSIRLHVTSSPGGSVNGLFPAIQALREIGKPIFATVESEAASATYMLLASVAKEITALNAGTRVGSVGVLATIRNPGDEIKEITNSESDKKRPDLDTVEGENVIKDELNSIFDYAVSLISEGRGVSASAVRSDFGRGAMMLAKDAKKVGMIDKILAVKKPSDDSKKVAATTGSVDNERSVNMTLAELKAQHPALYAEAVAEGVAKERDRVNAHLKWAEAGNNYTSAVKAIESGDAVTASLMAEYQIAAINAKMGDNRIADNPDIGATSGKKGELDEEDLVANLCEQELHGSAEDIIL